jgi:peptide deformylase
MAVKRICLLGNPLLREECQEVQRFNDRAIARTVKDLRDTLAYVRAANCFGRGIAAPQIGVTKKIVFLNATSPMVLLNPMILRRSRRMMTLWDDCFSFPDILVKVKRHVGVTVAYQDEQGHRRTLSAVGGLSDLLQHEIDHLDGILAIDRAIDSTHIILRSELKKITPPRDRASRF